MAVETTLEKVAFVPNGDRVLVKPAPKEETKHGGILIPEHVKEKPMRGTVVAVGPGRPREDGTVTPLSLHAGDEVLYGRFSGFELTLDGAEHVILNYDDIHGRLVAKK